MPASSPVQLPQLPKPPSSSFSLPSPVSFNLIHPHQTPFSIVIRSRSLSHR
jgi:hypothetical protein